MDKSIWQRKYEIIKEVQKRELPREEPKMGQYHYTSLPTLFNILDSDSFWITNVRFSNDSTEERLIGEKVDFRDDYIFCLSDHGDRLSQWRGYCYNGGASIEFNMQGPLEYSVLFDDYDATRKYELYENVPLPVVYVKNAFGEMKSTLGNLEAKVKGIKGVDLQDMLPFIKNIAFYEERESRMAFVNYSGSLSNCIRFRNLDNGVKIPYMVVKHGNMGRMLGTCTTNALEYSDDKIRELESKRKAIWIGEGTNQEKVYFDIIKRVEDYAKRHPKSKEVEVYCKGHLPIRSITVAPTYDRERLAEQVQRFCMSKYWLRKVKVEKSKIPYIQKG